MPDSTTFRIMRDVKIAAWDISLSARNAVSPKRKVGHVTPKGCPGFGGKWPEFVAPKEDDSRCVCPPLNAMANHGILSRDGKNVTFKELVKKLSETCNFAATFATFMAHLAATVLGKNFETDTFDLAELNLHSDKSIEHDGSLVRRDRYFEPNQSKIAMDYVEELIHAASGKGKDGNPLMTAKDMSFMLSKRIAESRATNPEFTLTKAQKTFGCSNASSLLTIFGGRIKDIEVLLKEERIPDGWESRVRETNGLTLLTLNIKVVSIYNGIDESKFVPAATGENDTAEAISAEAAGQLTETEIVQQETSEPS